MAIRRSKGEGSISRRANGKWRAYVTKDGQRIHYTGKTKSECQEWMRATLNQIDKGLTVKGANMTLKVYLEEWLKDKENNTGPQTFLDYSRYCRKDITPVLGNIKLKDLSINPINAFYTKLFENGRGLPTINYIHRVLHSALDSAIQKGYLGHNPSNKPSLPQPKSHKVVKMVALKDMDKKQGSELQWFEEDYVDKEMKVWTESELSHFLITALDSPHYALYDLVAKTGLRAGEVLGLLKRDVTFVDDYAVIRVRRQIKNIKDLKWIFLTPKTTSGIRTLKVGANTARVLKEHLQNLDVLKEVDKKRWHEYGLLFPSKFGTPTDLSNLRKEYNQLIEKAGLRRIRFHDLRHTVASILLSNKIPLVVVSKILGHAKVSTTSDIYYHFIPASSDEASNFMDALTPIKVDIATLTSDLINKNNLLLDTSSPIEFDMTPLANIDELDVLEN